MAENQTPSRSLKFRAWNPSTKQWDSPAVIEVFNNSGILESIVGAIITQFTGCVDKNGQEIYEGDIIITRHVFQKKGPANGDYRNPIVLGPEETRTETLVVVFEKISSEDEFYCADVVGWGLKDKHGMVRPLLQETMRHSVTPWEDSYIKHISFDASLVGNIFENPELCAK